MMHLRSCWSVALWRCRESDNNTNYCDLFRNRVKHLFNNFFFHRKVRMVSGKIKLLLLLIVPLIFKSEEFLRAGNNIYED